MYKHLQLLFLQNVEDTTRIVCLMKRCKATVWYRDETRNGQNKSVKEYDSAGDEQKGLIWFTRLNRLYLTLRVGLTHSTDQTIAQKPTTDWLKAHDLVIFNLKTPLYNHKLLSQSFTDLNHHFTVPDTDLITRLLLYCVPWAHLIMS